MNNKLKSSATAAVEVAIPKVYVMIGIWRDISDVVNVYETEEAAIKCLKGYTDMKIKDIEREKVNDEWQYNDYCGSRVVECEVQK